MIKVDRKNCVHYLNGQCWHKSALTNQAALCIGCPYYDGFPCAPATIPPLKKDTESGD